MLVTLILIKLVAGADSPIITEIGTYSNYQDCRLASFILGNNMDETAITKCRIDKVTKE